MGSVKNYIINTNNNSIINKLDTAAKASGRRIMASGNKTNTSSPLTSEKISKLLHNYDQS